MQKLIGKLSFTAAAFAGAMLSAEAALTAKSYVLDGLIWHLDGIENVRYGGDHDGTVTIWTDLTGNDINVPLWTDASFVDTGVLATRAKTTGKLTATNCSKIHTAFGVPNYTIECAYDKPSATTTPAGGYANTRCVFIQIGNNGQKFGTWADNQVGFSPNGTSSANYYSKVKSVTTTTGKHTLSCSQDSQQYWIRFDNTTPKTEALTPGTFTASHGTYVNGDAATTDCKCGLDGTYYAIRFYNRALTADEAAVNYAIDAVRFFGKDSSSITLPSGWRWSGAGSDVSLERQYAYSVEPAGAGLVSVDDGTAAASGTYWVEHNVGTQKTLVATANDGYAFVGWVGDGLTAEQKVNPTLSTTLVGSVTAVFRKTDGTDPRTYTWQGGVWDDRAAWRDEDGIPGLPLAFDSVVIPAKKTALLTNTTPKYAALTVSGTLSLTNWETCVKAAAVTVANGGKITLAGVSTDQATNRVWIACDDCTIAAGGKIDVDGLGFRGSKALQSGGKAAWVSGPGKGTAINIAASHGGHGGYGGNNGIGNTGFVHVLPYDNPASPMLPGSGGYPQEWGTGTDGGGAVYISATHRVTVNGSILASVKDMTNRGTNGSGGAINITCETFAGNGGVLKANGGTVDNTASGMQTYHWAAPGGGGMIAINYDPDQQTADLVNNMTISAEAGLLNSGKDYGDTVYRFEAGTGTVWLPDNTLLPSLFGKGLTGVLVNNTSSYVIEGDFEFAKGHVRWPGGAAMLSVSGNLSVTGKLTRLEVGGLYVTNQTPCANIYAGKVCNTLTVGGNLTIGDNGRLDIRAAETNAVMAFGARLSVEGALLVKTNGSLHCWSDQKNFGSPKVTAENVTVDEGGLVTAAMRGAGIRCAPYSISGDGASGAHGGKGGAPGYSSTKLKAFDDEWLPLMPGGGGCGGTYAAGGCGGGVIHLEAKRNVTVNGTLDAKGMDGNGSHPGGGGAGGTILIRCREFVGGTNAVLTAKGGNGIVQTSTGGGSGAGGRIAVWTGLQNLQPKHTERHLLRVRDLLPPTYLGTNTVDAGTHSLMEEQPRYSGEPGTLTWTTVEPLPGFMILVR